MKKVVFTVEDEIIVDYYLQRKEEAIQYTREKYGSRLRNVAYGIVKDHFVAEECENDTYMKVWEAIPPHEPREYFYMFLVRIVRQVALNRCREQKALKRDAQIEELSVELEQCIPDRDNVEEDFDDMVLREAINNFLRKQKKQKRQIFVRRYWYMDTVEEIAKMFGISSSKVKVVLFHMRSELHKYLEKEGYKL